MKKRILHIIFILLAVACSHAQDPLFSQFMQNKNLLNPSLLSAQSPLVSAKMSFREQGASFSDGLPLRTFQALVNLSHTSFKSDKFSYGLSVLGDKGGTGHVGSNMAHLNFAYLKKLTGQYSKVGEHYLGVGVTAGSGQRAVGWDRFWFGNQFDRTFNYIDTDRDPKEPGLQGMKGRTGLFADVNVGVHWYGNLNDDLAVQAGLSFYHLNRPNIALFEGAVERLPVRYNAHINAAKGLWEGVTIVQQILYVRQSVAHQLLIGADLQMDNLDASEVVLSLGVIGRFVAQQEISTMDAVILTFNTEYNNIRFGLAYDITVSSLAKYSNGRGAWEMNLGYAFGKTNKTGFHREKRRFRL
ncbi:PorP/SprF family type IX secretion system membrane protein [Portibacter marinus]|uniref:PorP/SprF family type IX secretion system membrane protein n=1 Tax=Portibacter marinus TaxID=2898660 RepID=UPI001F306ACA|nr:PorP/SprF family type IX secretion system membrane protein [Portibacter marinus]